jgi:hypothetical protein
MITKEKFTHAVQMSISFQRNESMTYFEWEERVYCPFCTMLMQAKKDGSEWNQICNCKESKEYQENILDIYKQQKDLEEKLNKLKKQVEQKVFVIYKRKFEEQIAPELLDNLKKEIQDVLSMENI